MEETRAGGAGGARGFRRANGGEVALGCLLAAALAVPAVALGWRGADWPAQLYRVDLFRRVGFTQWDNQWYGGHHTPGYSLLFPMLGAVLSPVVVGMASGVGATWAFGTLARRHLPAPAVATAWFAAATVTNLIVGRLTFALGMAVGLIAAVAMVAGRRWLAPILALLTPLSSPVAGLFLAVAAVAWGLAKVAPAPVPRVDRTGGRTRWRTRWRTSVRKRWRAWPRRWPALVVVMAALGPVLILAVTFPEGGRFPFLFGDFVLTVGVCAAVFGLVPDRHRALRIGAVLYAVAAGAAFFVPNPLGGNVTRMGVYLAGPVLAGGLWPVRRAAVMILALPLTLWQWQPAFDGIFRAGRDPSSLASYHAPLLRYLAGQDPTRVEVPFTRRHWETVYVAEHVPIARGWERQLDFAYNPLFYEPTGPSPTAYRAWLVANAVGFVALPDVELDPSARTEAALLGAGGPGLEPAWLDRHWRVWRVAGPAPLVEGRARLARIDPDSFTLDAQAAGDILVRIRSSSHWSIEGPGCVVASSDGWTRLRVPAPGQVRVRQVVSRWVPFRPDHADDCPPAG